MKYSLSDQPVATATVETFSPLQMAELNNELMEAYESLTDSVKELDAVQEIMENIRTSQMLLAKYGKDAIPQLNLDKGLEALCKVPENLITIEKAIESFGDAAKKAWESVKTWVSKIWMWIKRNIKLVFGKYSYAQHSVQSYVDSLKTHEFLAEKTNEFVPTFDGFSRGLTFLDTFVAAAFADNKSIQTTALKLVTDLESDHPEYKITDLVGRCQKSAELLNGILKRFQSGIRVEIVNETFKFTKDSILGGREVNDLTGGMDVRRTVLGESVFDKNKTYSQCGWTKEGTIRAFESFVSIIGKIRPLEIDDSIEQKILLIASKGEQSGKIDKFQLDAISAAVREVFSYFKIISEIEFSLTFELERSADRVANDCIVK